MCGMYCNTTIHTEVICVLFSSQRNDITLNAYFKHRERENESVFVYATMNHQYKTLIITISFRGVKFARGTANLLCTFTNPSSLIQATLLVFFYSSLPALPNFGTILLFGKIQRTARKMEIFFSFFFFLSSLKRV